MLWTSNTTTPDVVRISHNTSKSETRVFPCKKKRVLHGYKFRNYSISLILNQTFDNLGRSRCCNFKTATEIILKAKATACWEEAPARISWRGYTSQLAWEYLRLPQKKLGEVLLENDTWIPCSVATKLMGSDLPKWLENGWLDWH